MKKLIHKNEKGKLFQVREATPCFNTTKLLYRSLGSTDNYLVNWFIRNTAKSNEFQYEPIR